VCPLKDGDLCAARFNLPCYVISKRQEAIGNWRYMFPTDIITIQTVCKTLLVFLN
jgi:hypothetical protein